VGQPRLEITSAPLTFLHLVPQLTKVKYAVAQLLRLHAITNETAESQGRMTFPVSGRIVFDKVSFQYPSRPDAPVLKDVCFEVQPGECVAIVGYVRSCTLALSAANRLFYPRPSGSGKSTIAALLQRLYEPSSGMIRIDGRPTARTDVNFLRDHVAVVSQHPNLFDMTIANNIAYGRKDVPLDEIIKAAKAANVHDFIMSLPHEYKTNLGENAGLISGGQAQRLQIARALLKPREILLGDEITSALDAENQEIVMKTITDVKDGRTTVLITHTLATMQICDRLIVMDEGRVVQQGTFRDLQADTKVRVYSTSEGYEWELIRSTAGCVCYANAWR
jgi:ATP-binding cassette subfamily B (MDR/TAP) protein 1